MVGASVCRTKEATPRDMCSPESGGCAQRGGPFEWRCELDSVFLASFILLDGTGCEFVMGCLGGELEEVVLKAGRGRPHRVNTGATDVWCWRSVLRAKAQQGGVRSVPRIEVGESGKRVSLDHRIIEDPPVASGRFGS